MEDFDIPTDNKNNGLYKILDGGYYMAIVYRDYSHVL